jgi:hypothetical protein
VLDRLRSQPGDLRGSFLDTHRAALGRNGGSPATMMLIDRTVAAYQDFIRIAGWTGNAALMVEHEFFGVARPSANVLDRYGREAREIRGLSVEEHRADVGCGYRPPGVT